MKKTKEYCCSYYHDGSWWCLNMHAYDDEDLRARIAKLPHMRIDGEFGGSIPAVPGAGIFVRLIVWWRNFKSGRE